MASRLDRPTEGRGIDRAPARPVLGALLRGAAACICASLLVLSGCSSYYAPPKSGFVNAWKPAWPRVSAKPDTAAFAIDPASASIRTAQWEQVEPDKPGSNADGDPPRFGLVPLPPAAGPVTLGQAIEEALLRDPVTQVAGEAIQQARAEVLTASLKPNPTVSSVMSLLPLGETWVPEVREGGPPQYDLILGYPIDWWLFGKQAAAVESARRGIAVAEADRANVIRERINATIAAFYDVLEAKALLELAREEVEHLGRVAQITEELVRLEAESKVELSRARLELMGAERELREAELALFIPMAQLRALMGREGADPTFDVEGTLDIAEPPPPLVLTELLDTAWGNRPDVISLQRQMDQAAAEIVAERKQGRAEVELMGGYTRQFQEQSMGNPDANSWQIGVDFSLPIFDRNQGNIRRAESALRQVQHELRAARLEVQSEVEQALASLQQATATAVHQGPREVEAATQLRAIIQAAYEEEAATLLEVLDVERTFLETHRTYIQSRADYWRSLHEVNAAVGRRVLP